MTLALTNLDLLHRGWEDAVSEITPHLPEVRATMETQYAGLQHENRIDEQALLAAVREVAAVAARAAGADKARLLSRSMHRSLYEYLLSLDAMTPEETAGEAEIGGAATDPSRLIGIEEVAEIEGRQAAIRAEEEAAAAAIEAAAKAEADRVAAEHAEAERAAAEAERLEAEERATAERIAAELRAEAERAAAARAAAEQAAAERAAAHRAAAERAAQERAAAERAAQERAEAEAERIAAEERAAAERAAAYRASLDTEAAPEVEELPGVDPAGQSELETDDEAAAGGFYRPRFKLFRRGSGDTAETEGEEATTGSPSWWRGPDAPPAPQEPEAKPAAAPDEPVQPAASIAPAASTEAAPPVEPAPASRPAPFAEPAPVPRPNQAAAPEVRAKAPAPDAGFAVQPRDGFHLTEFADFVRPVENAALQPATEAPEEAPPAVDGDTGKVAKGWHVRRSHRPNSGETADLETDDGLDEDDWEERRLIDSDPAVAQAHGDVNDLLRRRKCDEAAALLQKLAADHGSRSVAELALDAGDRCRALGKGNAALSCYIAASRADPSFEGPLMRLADVCLDDRDIDLAVTYLERVAKLHRQRGDNRGALRLYRKIATIAPYRDDILATLMRANTTGQFED